VDRELGEQELRFEIGDGFPGFFNQVISDLVEGLLTELVSGVPNPVNDVVANGFGITSQPDADRSNRTASVGCGGQRFEDVFLSFT
jgi:hypothetical protein